MKLTIIGTAYAGLVTAACFADMGDTLACLDTGAAKIEGLRQGWMLVFEPGLESLVVSNAREGIFNGRNQHDPKQVHAAGFEYFGIGR